MTRKETIMITLIGGMLVLLIFCFYMMMRDMGLFDGTYQNTALAKVSSVLSGGFLMVRLWNLWDMFVGLITRLAIIGLIVFILAGVGVILGF